MRLIDADALNVSFIKKFPDLCVDRYVEQNCGYSRELVHEFITNAPTIDAVPVVRCKDCELFDERYKGFGFCKEKSGLWKSEDFCSHGKRKEEA